MNAYDTYKKLEIDMIQTLKMKGFGRKQTYHLIDSITGKAYLGNCKFDMDKIADLEKQIRAMSKSEIKIKFS